MIFGAISKVVFCKFSNRVEQKIVENGNGAKSKIIANRL